MQTILSQKERTSLFPIIKKCIYLNTASTGIIPQVSISEMERFMKRYSGDRIEHDAESFKMFDNLRELLASFLGAAPERLALTFNTSYGINVAANGLPIEHGDKIVLPPDEFPANFFPWQQRAQRGAQLVIADEANEEALDIEGAKVIAMSWVRYFDGLRFDLQKCSNIAQRKKTFLCIDGIQGAGVLRADLHNSGVHTFAAGGQKWMMSPYGTGILYVREGTPIQPIFTGWLSRFQANGDYSSLRKYNLPPPPDARAFELGTLPYHNLWAMFRSAELIAKLGIDEIESYTTGLAKSFADEIYASNLGTVMNRTRKIHSSITSVKMPGQARIHRELKKLGIICAHREGCLRFSFHIYNTSEDIERTVSALKEVCKK